jgi:hypothetical protein
MLSKVTFATVWASATGFVNVIVSEEFESVFMVKPDAPAASFCADRLKRILAEQELAEA